MIIDYLAEMFGLHDDDSYENHLDDPVYIFVDNQWYRTRVRNLSDLEHLLSVHPIRDGKINVRFDTGLCGRDALANDLRPAATHLHDCGADYLTDEERDFDRSDTLKFRWNPEAGNDGSRLFYGAFELIKSEETHGQEEGS